MRSQANARRVSLAGHPGVYYRLGRDGRRRYEITFRDSTGVRRWRTIDGGLREADAALRSVHHRQDRGERVVATTATLAEVAAAYLAAQTEIRPRTREKYETGLRVHVLPRLGRRRIATITTDDVAAIVAAMRDEGRAGWTIRGVLVPLSRVFAYAVRRGYLAVNPVSALERSERPKVGRRAKRVLSADEIGRLLDAATPLYRPILALAAYTGLRQSECLGLHWRDVDFEAGFVRVRAQLDRSGERVEPKTSEAVRDVVLAPALGRMLRAHRLASRHSGDGDFVFVNEAGRPFSARNVQARGFDRAARIAGLDEGAERKATFHDLRRTFGSMLIAAGADIVHVSKQLGHADPAITLRVYADEFAARDNADRTRTMLDAVIVNVLDRRA